MDIRMAKRPLRAYLIKRLAERSMKANVQDRLFRGKTGIKTESNLGVIVKKLKITKEEIENYRNSHNLTKDRITAYNEREVILRVAECIDLDFRTMDYLPDKILKKTILDFITVPQFNKYKNEVIAELKRGE